MGKVKRIERVAALTKELVDHPYELYSFTDFCERFDVAKSTLSEDVQAIKNGLVAYDLIIAASLYLTVYNILVVSRHDNTFIRNKSMITAWSLLIQIEKHS